MKKILIVFATRHGTTEKIVSQIVRYLPEAEVLDLRKGPGPSLDEFETVVVGGPIQAGKIHKKVKNFCLKNQNILLRKKLALFICCMYDGEKAEEQFDKAFPETLRAAAGEKAILLGELNFEKMNFLERFVIKNFIGVKQSVSRLQPEEIERFAQRIRSLSEQP